MKIDELIALLYQKRHEIRSNENREPTFIVYLDSGTWQDMMRELSGQVGPAHYSMFESRGNAIMGYKIYKVESGEMHVKIFEDK